MNGIKHVDRLWAGLGVAVAVILLAISWIMFIGPQYAQAGTLQDETEMLRTRAAALQQRTAQLRKENDDLAEYQAKVQTYRRALPTETNQSDFLRELQRAGENAGLSVNGVTIGSPLKAEKARGQIYAFPITLTAVGGTAQIDRLLHQLQQVQPRAVLINSVNVAPNAESEAGDTTSTLTVDLRVFVEPPPGVTPSAPAG